MMTMYVYLYIYIYIYIYRNVNRARDPQLDSRKRVPRGQDCYSKVWEASQEEGGRYVRYLGEVLYVAGVGQSDHCFCDINGAERLCPGHLHTTSILLLDSWVATLGSGECTVLPPYTNGRTFPPFVGMECTGVECRRGGLHGWTRIGMGMGVRACVRARVLRSLNLRSRESSCHASATSLRLNVHTRRHARALACFYYLSISISIDMSLARCL